MVRRKVFVEEVDADKGRGGNEKKGDGNTLRSTAMVAPREERVDRQQHEHMKNPIQHSNKK